MNNRNGPGAHIEAESVPDTVRHRMFVVNDPKSQAVLDQIDRVAGSDAPVLIVGETGVGKELVARHLHAQSGRSGPFVAVNCGAVTQSLAEAELFGHQAGAFTGASETRAGWFEAANGGTLFLDEIGDLPQPLQVKLLRVLQEREVVRVGSRKAITLDVRLVAATNADLTEAVTSGKFRLDLFYRLNVLTLHLPPLRQRQADVLPLVEHFLDIYSRRLRIGVPRLTPEAVRALQRHAWPGNIRELENVIHAAVLLSSDGSIRPQDLRFTALPSLTDQGAKGPIEQIAAQLDRLFAAPPANLHQQIEDLLVKRAFGFAAGNQVQTARLLGISRNVLRTLLKRYGLIAAEAAAADDETSDDDTSATPLR